MNSTTYKRKLEIYQELAELLSFKRKQAGKHNLASFVDTYLTTLTEYKRPPFHIEIMQNIEKVVKQPQNGGIRETYIEKSPTKSAKRHPMEHQNEDNANNSHNAGTKDTTHNTHTTAPITAYLSNDNTIVGVNYLNTPKDAGTTQRIDKNGQEEGMMTPATPPSKDSYITPTSNSSNFSDDLPISDKNSKSDNNFSKNFGKKNRLLFIAPRGFAKSTVCSRFFPLWLALYAHKKDIMLISSTVSLAKENLRIIRTQLENNEKLIKDFGDLKSDKWTEEQLNLTNGVTIRAKGRGFQIRGFRPDIIICDDLESDEMVASKDQREKLENWFLRELLPTLTLDQHLIYIGTMLHQFALIAKLRAKEEFEAFHYKAVVQVNGKDASIWEEMWPIKRLHELKEELGVYAFESEYQNNPLSMTEQPIKPHHINNVRAGGAIVEACMAIDPAISERENADYTAIQIMGKTEDGEFRELLTEKGRWGIEEQLDKVIDLYVRYNKKWNILRVLVEEVAYQKVLRPLLTSKARARGVYLPTSTAELGMGDNKRPKDKRTRLMQIVHLFEGRLVEITNPDTKIELLSFPFGDYDDMVDVTVYNLYWLIHNRPGRYVMKKEKEGLPIQTKKSFFVEEIRPGVFATRFEGIPKLEIVNNVLNYDK